MLLLQYQAVDPNTAIAPVISAFFDKFDSITESAKVWLTVGKTIGCIGAYAYIFKKFGTKIMSGETFGLSDVAYPVFVAFLLSVYTPVATGIEKLFTGAYDTAYVSNTVGEIYRATSRNGNSGTVDEEKKKLADGAVTLPESTKTVAEEYMKNDNATSAGYMKAAMNLIKIGYQSMMNSINNAVLNAMMAILEVLIVCCIATIFFLAKLYISFLYIFGPFSIGMSLIPGFESSLANWFQKYIGYSLWMPIAGTIANITKEVVLGSAKIADPDSLMQAPIVIVALLIAAVMLIVSMLAVPKIASNVIATSVGSSSTSSKMMSVMNMGKGGGGATDLAAAAATGGTSAIAAQAASAAATSGGGGSDNSGNAAQAPQRPTC